VNETGKGRVGKGGTSFQVDSQFFFPAYKTEAVAVRLTLRVPSAGLLGVSGVCKEGNEEQGKAIDG
jgi:hypothetical protein